jgi:hypothetical protein
MPDFVHGGWIAQARIDAAAIHRPLDAAGRGA